MAFVQELCSTQEYKLTNLVRSGWLVYLEVNRRASASIFRESSFNMTRGADEDIETRSLKF